MELEAIASGASVAGGTSVELEAGTAAFETPSPALERGEGALDALLGFYFAAAGAGHAGRVPESPSDLKLSFKYGTQPIDTSWMR